MITRVSPTDAAGAVVPNAVQLRVDTGALRCCYKAQLARQCTLPSPPSGAHIRHSKLRAKNTMLLAPSVG